MLRNRLGSAKADLQVAAKMKDTAAADLQPSEPTAGVVEFYDLQDDLQPTGNLYQIVGAESIKEMNSSTWHKLSLKYVYHPTSHSIFRHTLDTLTPLSPVGIVQHARSHQRSSLSW